MGLKPIAFSSPRHEYLIISCTDRRLRPTAGIRHRVMAMISERILQGRYRLLHTLGAGGMGSVWLAEDRWLQRLVALKQLVQHAGGADLDERRARALREARAMARVRHPAIVSIIDIFFEGGDPWIVMDYICGRSLDVIIESASRSGQPLEEQVIAAIGLPVLRGLGAAHQASVVHRDVKPANILVADDKSIFLVDFGIAKMAGDMPLTSTRTVMGTAEFLAPERIRGEEAGPAADLWSLGVTLFHALEGYSPFRSGDGSCPEATMWAILHEDPPRPVRAGRLADVVLRLLDKDPAARADASELSDVLQSITAGPKTPRPDPAVPPRPGGHRLSADGAGLAFEDAHEVILTVSADTGVAMLLAMPNDQAAKILVSCPPDLCHDLLKGVAAAWPGKAGAMLRMLLASEAARMVGHLKPDTAASVLATVPARDAARILGHTGVRTAARIIAKMSAPVAAPLVEAMPVHFRAQVIRLL